MNTQVSIAIRVFVVTRFASTKVCDLYMEMVQVDKFSMFASTKFCVLGGGGNPPKIVHTHISTDISACDSSCVFYNCLPHSLESLWLIFIQSKQ